MYNKFRFVRLYKEHYSMFVIGGRVFASEEIRAKEIRAAFVQLLRLFSEDARFFDKGCSVSIPYFVPMEAPKGWLRIQDRFHRNAIMVKAEVICDVSHRHDNSSLKALKAQDSCGNGITAMQAMVPQMYCVEFLLKHEALGDVTLGDLLPMIQNHPEVQEGSSTMCHHNLQFTDEAPVYTTILSEFELYEIRPKVTEELNAELDKTFGIPAYGELAAKKLSEVEFDLFDDEITVLVFAVPKDVYSETPLL